MKEAQIILQKLDEMSANSFKSWLSSLNENSSVLLTTQDIANLMGFSYHHTYTEIVAHPNFPSPVLLANKTKRNSHRRWVAGEVVKYIKSISK